MRTWRIVACLVVGLAAAACSTAPMTFATTTRGTALATTSTSSAPVARDSRCSWSELVVGGVGGSGAAGTGVTTIRIENKAHRSCVLRGYPLVDFLARSGAPLPTTVGHAGPGYAFRPPSVVTLPPGKAAAAGFVVTSGDWPTGTEQACPTATSALVRLPGVTKRFLVTLAVRIVGVQLCSPGSPVNVSAVADGTRLFGYAAQTYAPKG